jgi:hypothetical protein
MSGLRLQKLAFRNEGIKYLAGAVTCTRTRGSVLNANVRNVRNFRTTNILPTQQNT